MSCSFRVTGIGGGSRAKQTYLWALPWLVPMPTAGSRQLADRSVSWCHGEKTGTSFRALKAMDVFHLQNFLPVTHGPQIGFCLLLQTAWSRLFPAATLQSSLKATQEFWVPAVSLAGSPRALKDSLLQQFPWREAWLLSRCLGEGKIHWLPHSASFLVVAVIWGSWCSGQNCPSHDVTAMEFRRA